MLGKALVVDNALAENVNGSYKNELIHTRRWNDVVEVEIATFEWEPFTFSARALS